MRAELKLLNMTAQRLRPLVRIKRDGVTGFSCPQNSSRRFRIRVTDKQNRMLRNFEETAGENIGQGFGSHHPAGKRINAAGTRWRIVDRLTIKNKGGDILEQLQPRPLPASLVGATIINLRHFGAQAADVSGKVPLPLSPKLIKHPERLLRFAECKNGNKDAAVTPKGCFNCIGEFFFFGSA